MLMNWNILIEKFNKPKGIIHIGAHLAEEKNLYRNIGCDNTIWIEANPEKYNSILNLLTGDERAFNYAITDIDNEKIPFYVTNNGQSSSIFEMDKHLEYYKDIVVSKVIDVTTKRMDSLIKDNNIDINLYNFLNIDIQGAELLALKSFGELLNKIDLIYIEVNFVKLYTGTPLLEEIDNYLKLFNIYRVDCVKTEYGWGDAFYKRG